MIKIKNNIDMEFKGTKGKWEVIANIKGLEVSNSIQVVCFLQQKHIEEETANALLISKAPEMLEMLKRVINDRLWGSDDDIEDIEKLIKEATEL